MAQAQAMVVSDILGFQFVQPVLLPYAMSLGGTIEIVAAFNTVRFSLIP